jgi:hypothetical protein
MRKVVIGFLAAPCVTPLAIWVCFSLFYLFGIGGFERGGYGLVLSTTWLFADFATPIAYVATIIGAVPAFILFRRRHLLGLKHLVTLGTALGLLPFLVYFAYVALWEVARALSRGWDQPSFGTKATLLRLMGDVPTALAWSALGIYCGMASATFFWVFAIRGNAAIDPSPQASH